MSNEAWSDAIKEAYASAPQGVVTLNTLELSHPALPGQTKYMVQAHQDYDLTLEDSSVHTFEGFAFEFKLPPAGDKGIQDLQVQMDNTDRSIGDFFNACKEFREPISLKFRPYLSNDLTTPQMSPPLKLNVVDVKITESKVTCRATFADLLNRKYPLELYTRKRFRSLGG